MTILKKLSALFSSEIDGLQYKVMRDRLAQSAILSLGICFGAAPLLAPTQPKEMILWELGLSSVFGASSAGLSKLREQQERQYSSFLALNVEHYASKQKQVFAVNMAAQTMDIESKLAEEVEKRFYHIPPAVLRYAQKFELFGLLNPQLNLVSNPDGTSLQPEIEAGNFTLDVLRSQIEEVEKSNEASVLYWLDDAFVDGSKVVVGAKGSGKSTYLRYEAARWFITHTVTKRDGQLFIYDPHYDSEHPETTPWLPGIDPTVLQNGTIYKSARDIYNNFYGYIRKELENRIDKSLRPPHVPLIKIIWDEEENIKRRLNNEEFGHVLSTLEFIQDEGRKYGVEISVGMHSLKKENTGIDSASLQQMHWLLFEKASYDSTTKYPSDFDQKSIRDAAKQLSSQIPKDVGKLIVVIRTDYTDPVITILPYLQPPKVVFPNETEEFFDEKESSLDDEIPPEKADLVSDTESETVITNSVTESEHDLVEEHGGISLTPWMKLENWIEKCISTYNRVPPSSDILIAWVGWTGQTLTERGFELLSLKLQERFPDWFGK